MDFDQYHEPPAELPPATRTFARMIKGLIEEAEAIDWYEQRMAVETDEEANLVDKNNDKTDSGGFDTLPTFEVPRAVLQAALKATKPIGNGFYGVDVKQWGDKAFVIEVNDNPSIDAGVEDQYLGNELYSLIMQEFVRRMEE